MSLKLYCTCKYCGLHNKLLERANTRFELQFRKGNIIVQQCTRCGSTTEHHVNKIQARPNYRLLVFSIIFSLILVLFTYRLGWLNVLLFALPFIIWRFEDIKVSIFNKIMVDDHTAVPIKT